MSSLVSHSRSLTVDRILAFRVLIECLRDFRSGLLAACVDLRKAFDSVNRDLLWRILALHGIQPKLVNLISGLYSGTESALAPTLLHVLGRMSEKSGCGVSELSGSLILTLQMMRLYSRRQPKFLRGHSIR